MSIRDTPLPQDAETISYATRGMEPHRGFPEFMRALALLQARRPKLHAVIGGEDRVAYGAKLPPGDSWKKRMLDELELDLSRVHFVGLLSRQDYTRLLLSTHVHVYLTVPFVLSWSLVEAMSVVCPIVASDTDPVREAMTHDRTGLLVQHRDIEAVARAIKVLIEDRERRGTLGRNAPAKVLSNYDSRWIWPARANLLDSLLAGKLFRPQA